MSTSETLKDRVDWLERRLKHIEEHLAETAERTSARFPSDKRVAEAVDRFIGAAGSSRAA
jgi:hypothetical protein